MLPFATDLITPASEAAEPGSQKTPSVDATFYTLIKSLHPLLNL